MTALVYQNPCRHLNVYRESSERFGIKTALVAESLFTAVKLTDTSFTFHHLRVRLAVFQLRGHPDTTDAEGARPRDTVGWHLTELSHRANEILVPDSTVEGQMSMSQQHVRGRPIGVFLPELNWHINNPMVGGVSRRGRAATVRLPHQSLRSDDLALDASLLFSLLSSSPL